MMHLYPKDSFCHYQMAEQIAKHRGFNKLHWISTKHCMYQDSTQQMSRGVHGCKCIMFTPSFATVEILLTDSMYPNGA